MITETISDILELTAKIMELHQENPFKIKAISSAAYRISKMNLDLSGKTIEELETIEGIGKGIAAKIDELNQTGTTKELQVLLQKTPEGLLDVLKVKGLGPKKVAQLWKELQIESVGELLYACNENRLIKLKGFGVKSQEEIKKSVEFLFANKDKYHYAYAAFFANEFIQPIKQLFPDALISFTGELYRKAEVISVFDLLIEERYSDKVMEWSKKQAYPFQIHVAPTNEFYYNLVKTSSTDEHLNAIHFNDLKTTNQLSEEEVYQNLNTVYFPAELREGLWESDYINKYNKYELIENSDLKGCLHNHSTYSDGLNSIEEMAKACVDLGLTYFGLCDHSQSAVYANGLKPETVLLQHEEIDALNKKLFPFRILKGIESDILSDGSLDYEESILKQFDFVVASIHQGFKMDETKATDRIIKAIENPYTKILGHPTGRLLLSRPGYPINHKKIIDACSANDVSIELNAHPYRLDIDWRWIPYCMEKNVMISINPDAHAISGISDMQYGVYAARKGMLNKEFCLNAKSLEELIKYWKLKN
jgi:DNA polymerase (family 10)